MMTIGELATRAGVSRDALRYYERVGLMSPVHRTRAGYRTYGAAAVERVAFIRHAQALSFSLADIGTVLAQRRFGNDRECRRVREMLARKLDDLERQLAQLRQFQETVRSHLSECDRSLADARPDPCPIMTRLERVS